MQKYNMFVAQMGCAAIGVLALSAFGPGWLARSAALAASIGFMIWTRSVHPPGNFSRKLTFSLDERGEMQFEYQLSGHHHHHHLSFMHQSMIFFFFVKFSCQLAYIVH